MYYITADSTGDYPEEFSDFNNFYKLPMPYTIGDEHYTLNTPESLSLKDFYTSMKNGANPITSCVSPHTAIELWTKTLKEGFDILHIGFSSGMSATLKNLELAAAELRTEFPDRKIIIIDSLCAGIGEAILLYRAAKNRESGLQIEDNAKDIESVKNKVCHYLIVNDLFHLKRGGRISGFSAMIGTAIQIKPIITVNSEGHLETVEKAISRKVAIKHLLNRVTASINDETENILISEADCREDADFIKSKLGEKYPNKNIFISKTGHIMLSHVGIGFIGIAFIGKIRKKLNIL